MDKTERAAERKAAHYKPGRIGPLPRLTGDRIAAVIRAGWVRPDGTEPTDLDVSLAVLKFDSWREFDGAGAGFRRQPRTRVRGRNLHHLNRFLQWVLMWDRRTHSAADAKPIRVRDRNSE